MKKGLIFLACLFLGPALGCFLSGTWHNGANTFWEKIDYFPYPVKNIITLKPFGEEFWVETVENETYQITYPCSKGSVCWVQMDYVPFEPIDGETINISNNSCENSNFVYPLPYKIKKCATSVALAESPFTSSLALTNKDELWIWIKPWESPYTVLLNMALSIIIGGLIGYLSGIVLAAYLPSTKKRKNT